MRKAWRWRAKRDEKQSRPTEYSKLQMQVTTFEKSTLQKSLEVVEIWAVLEDDLGMKRKRWEQYQMPASLERVLFSLASISVDD